MRNQDKNRIGRTPPETHQDEEAHHTPIPLFILLILSIFASEMFLMMLFARLWPGGDHPRWIPVIDATLLVMVLFPILYLSHYRPMARSLKRIRNTAEELLEKSVYLDNILRYSTDMAIVATDPDWRVMYFNPFAEDIFGRGVEDVIGTNILEAIAEESIDTRRLQEAKDIVLKQGEYRFSFEKNSENGRQYINARLAGIRDERGGVVGYALMARDVTARRRNEEELARLATAIEQAAEPVIITDADGTIQYVNPAFERTTGYSRDEAVGENPRFLKSGEQDGEFYRNMWDTIRGGASWRGTFINRKKDGSFYEGEATISPVVNSSGRITNYVDVQRDVTNEKRLERQIRHTQKMEAIGTLAGGIAHDFNNILGAILGYTELAEEAAVGQTAILDDLAEVTKAGLRAKDLVKQILTFSRWEEREMRPIDLTLIVNETMKLVRATIPGSIDIRHNIDPGEMYVMADAIQIQQVLLNLCANAEHAMRENGGTLEVSLHALDRDHDAAEASGDQVKLTVGDTGHGIDKKVMDRIFEPFFTTKEVGEGTGLGLSAVHGIITSHGGAITAVSEPGEGTTFSIYLPRCEPEFEAAPTDLDDAPRGHECVLFADDETALVNMTRQALEGLGYTVFTAANGAEALELFKKRENEIDIVIADQAMPVMTGEALTKELMKIRPGLPVILCSGFSETLNIEKAIAIGAKDYLIKPILTYDLAIRIRTALDDSKERERRLRA